MEKTFTLLVRRHQADLMRCAKLLTASHDDAKDLLQLTLLAGYRFFDTFTIGTDFGAWLYRIMKNQFLNYQRGCNAEQRIPAHKLFTIDNESRPWYANNIHLSTPAHPYEELFCDEVADALDALSPESREILLMADIEEISLWEIAERQGSGEIAVRSRLRRARNAMLDHLKVFGHAEGYRIGSRKIGSSKRQRTTIKALDLRRSEI